MQILFLRAGARFSFCATRIDTTIVMTVIAIMFLPTRILGVRLYTRFQIGPN